MKRNKSHSQIFRGFAVLALCGILNSCQTLPQKLLAPNPYKLQSWIRCSPEGINMTNIELYLWNRSAQELEIWTETVSALDAQSKKLGLAEYENPYNIKYADGHQTFQNIQPESSHVKLRLNDSVDFEMKLPVNSANLKLKFELSDAQNKSYEVVLSCQN